MTLVRNPQAFSVELSSSRSILSKQQLDITVTTYEQQLIDAGVLEQLADGTPPAAPDTREYVVRADSARPLLIDLTDVSDPVTDQRVIGVGGQPVNSLTPSDKGSAGGALATDTAAGAVETGLTVLSSPVRRSPRGLSEATTVTAMNQNRQAIIDAAMLIAGRGRGYGRIDLPEAVLHLGQALDLNAVAPGCGLSLIGDGAGTRLVQDGDYHALSIGGDPRGTAITVTTSAVVGDSTLIVASTAGLRRGQLCELRSDKVFRGSNCEGETVCIQSIDSATQVTLAGPVGAGTFTGYSTVDQARLLPLNLIDGITVSNLFVVNPTPETLSSADALRIRGCRRAVVEDFRTEGVDDTGIVMWDSPFAEIRHPGFQRHTNDITNGRNGYGILAYGRTDHLQVTGGFMMRGRHFLTTGAASTGVSPRFIDVVGARATMTTRTPFDTHPAARFVRYIGCHASQISDGSGGFNHRSPDCAVIDCEVDNAGAGVTFSGGATNHADRGVIRGLICRNLRGVAVKLSGVDDCKVDGADIFDSTVSTTAIYVGKDDETGVASSNRCTVQNVNARNIGPVGGRGDVLAFVSGDGHAYDNIRGDGINALVQMQAPVTNTDGGRLYPHNAAAVFRSDVAASYGAPATIHTVGAPEGVVKAPMGTLLVRSDGKGTANRYVKETGAAMTNTGWRRERSISRADRRRSSAATTLNPRDGSLASQNIGTGAIFAAYAEVLEPQTFAKVRFRVGTTMTSVSDLRLGVWDCITRALLAQTANLIGLSGITAPAADTLIDNVPLLAPVDLTDTPAVFLGIGAVGTAFQAYGISTAASDIAKLSTPPDSYTASGYTGGSLPALSAASSFRLPWIELIP